MGIKDKILEALKTKFSGVDDAILDRIATKKAEGQTDETRVNSIVEGIKFSDVLQSYGDYRAGDASISAVSNYEKKYNIKDGNPIEKTIEHKEELKQETTKQEPTDDKIPTWAQAIIDSNKSFSESLTKMQAERQESDFMAGAKAKAKEYGITDEMLSLMNIPKDKDLDEFFKNAKQVYTNNGFQESHAPESAEEKIEKENESIAKMIDERTKEETKTKN